MFVNFCWVVLALIHIMPALALFRPELLTSLYGVEAGASSFLLLQHRAALFAGVVATCIWAWVRPEARQLAVVVVAISMLSFLVLFFISGMPQVLRIIAIADLVGAPLLFTVALQAFRLSTQSQLLQAR